MFAFFVDASRLVRWIGLDAQLDPVPGGQFRFEVQPGSFCEGRYTIVEPPTRVAFTWGWSDESFGLPPAASLVEVELSEHADGTLVRLVHSRLPGPLRTLHDEGWASFLPRLVAVVAGRDPGRYPLGAPR